jgi:hypothetical protein
MNSTIKGKLRWVGGREEGCPSEKMEASVSLASREYEIENTEQFVTTYLQWKELPLVKVDHYYRPYSYYPSKTYPEAKYMNVILELKKIAALADAGQVSNYDVLDKVKSIVKIAETPPIAVA